MFDMNRLTKTLKFSYIFELETYKGAETEMKDLIDHEIFAGNIG